MSGGRIVPFGKVCFYLPFFCVHFQLSATSFPLVIIVGLYLVVLHLLFIFTSTPSLFYLVVLYLTLLYVPCSYPVVFFSFLMVPCQAETGDRGEGGPTRSYPRV